MNTELHPTIFVIYGATGDLFKKKIASALFQLFVKGEMPKKFEIVAYARKDYTNAAFREYVRELLPAHHSVIEKDAFLKNVSYVQGQFDALEDYENLANYLYKIDNKMKTCTNKLFYLAVPPMYYSTIFNNLSRSGLTIPCGPNEGWTRVLVEKPFGKDLKTAQELDKEIAQLFKGEQIFIIDHYLAKEPVQNILAFRFFNAIFEPVWNRDYIDSIDINLFETKDVSTRGNFYDGVGTLRDVGQNHMLQMLALVTMEKPAAFTADSIRAERMKVFSKLSDVHCVARAQYDGFLTENGVSPTSTTETFFSLKTEIKNSRWKGVPIRLTAGKALSESKAEIVVRFKLSEGTHNTITFRIQPDEAIFLNFVLKMPGFRNEAIEDSLSFQYKDKEITSHIADAYEKVLFDAIVGDQTLFASSEEIKASWKFVTAILSSWENVPMTSYKKGAYAQQIINEHCKNK